MKKVPLVVYRDGKRDVIGEASVDEDSGDVQGTVYDEIELHEAVAKGFSFRGKL